ncbi:MAG TPA: hypothetical protein EYH32_04325 [Anaerolineae bacterium]|nr:hypothetical protein [Anaerolineae bacterium]
MFHVCQTWVIGSSSTCSATGVRGGVGVGVGVDVGDGVAVGVAVSDGVNEGVGVTPAADAGPDVRPTPASVRYTPMPQTPRAQSTSAMTRIETT